MNRLSVLFLFLLLAACARPSKPIWTELPSSQALLQRLAATTGQVQSLDAAATVSMSVKGKFFSSQQFLLVEKPDRLRTDVLTGFGQLILQLTSDGEELSVFSNTTVPGRFFRGPATAENLIRFTRIPLAADDMVRLLLYDPPLIGFQLSEVLERENGLVLRLSSPDLQQELTFNAQLQLSGCRYAAKDKVILEVEYENIDEEKGFPKKIQINVVAEETRATLKFSELTTNVQILPERFRLKKPNDIPVEDLP